MKKAIVLLLLFTLPTVSVTLAQTGSDDLFHRKYGGMQGDILRVTHRVYTESEPLPYLISIDEFDENGNLVRQQSFNREGEEVELTEIRYENNEEAEIVYTIPGSGATRVVHRRTGRNGQEESWVREEDGSEPRTYVKVYDPLKRTVTRYSVGKRGKRTFCSESTYDERGNEISVRGNRSVQSLFDGNHEIRRTTGEGASRRVVTFRYDKFDERGNWKECSSSVDGGTEKPGVILVKEFEYR